MRNPRYAASPASSPPIRILWHSSSVKPPGHAAISIGIGGIAWAVTTSPYSMLAATATGIAVDLDHLLEYYLWFIKGDNSRVFYFLHSYELLVPVHTGGSACPGETRW